MLGSILTAIGTGLPQFLDRMVFIRYVFRFSANIGTN